VVREIAGGDQLEFPTGHVVHKTTGYLSDVRVSPDGSRVAFMEHPVKFDNRGWVKVVNRAGAVATLAGEYSGEEGVAWTKDGTSVLFSTSGGRVFSVPADGSREPTRFVNSAGALYIHDVATSGRLIITREESRTGVAARGAGQPAERDLTTFGSEWGPTLSPDGSAVMFTQSGGDYSVIVRGVDGSAPVQLGVGNGGAYSPDGRWVSANVFSKGHCVIYPTGSGKAIPLEMGPLESCLAVGWFPDGKHIIIVGNERGQPVRTYQAAFPGGTPQLLLSDEVNAAGLQGSGGGSRGKCLIASNATGTWRRFDLKGFGPSVAQMQPTDTLLSCAPDGSWAIVGNDTAIPAVAYRVDLATGDRRKLAEIAPADRVGLLRVFITDYWESGEYAYWYVRGLSTLYSATPVQAER
jgi:dipeptidyl aminopeptidase/acylaminoacyl peptidase